MWLATSELSFILLVVDCVSFRPSTLMQDIHSGRKTIAKFAAFYESVLPSRSRWEGRHTFETRRPFSCKCVMLQLQSCACTADSLLEIFSCRLYLIYGVPTYSSRLVFWVCFAPITLSGDSDLQRQNFSVVDLLDGGCSIVSSSYDRTYQKTQPPLSSRQHVNARIGAARSLDFSGISAIATENLSTNGERLREQMFGQADMRKLSSQFDARFQGMYNRHEISSGCETSIKFSMTI